MPKFGDTDEVLAISLDAAIRGPDNPVADPNEQNKSGQYFAEPGWMIWNVRTHEINKQGSAWRLQIYSPDPPDYTLKYEKMIEVLRTLTGGLFDSVTSNDQISSTYNLLVTASNSPVNWARAISASAKVIAGTGKTSKMRVDYYAQLVYVGNEADVNKLLSEWLSGLTVEVKLSYKDLVDKLGYINTANHNVQGDLLIVNNKGNNPDGGSVYYDSDGFPAGCIGSFNARVSSIGMPKTCEVVIWELPAKQKGSAGTIQVSDWIDIISSYTSQNDSVLRFEIYSHDNVENDTVIDLASTTLTIQKSF